MIILFVNYLSIQSEIEDIYGNMMAWTNNSQNTKHICPHFQ